MWGGGGFGLTARLSCTARQGPPERYHIPPPTSEDQEDGGQVVSEDVRLLGSVWKRSEVLHSKTLIHAGAQRRSTRREGRPGVKVNPARRSPTALWENVAWTALR